MQDDKFLAIQSAVRAGNKIEAIKLYRELFGVGLAEAKDAVEHLEAALPAQGGTAAFTPSSGMAWPADVLAEARQHLFNGQKIAAIKLIRDCHASGRLPGPVPGLAEAKAEVDRMEAELRLQSPGSFRTPPASGAMGCVVLAALLAGLGYGVWQLLH